MRLAAIWELDMGLLLFASAVILALLAGTAAQRQRNHHMHVFVNALWAMLACTVNEALFLLGNGSRKLWLLTYLSNLLTILCGAAFCVLFVQCLVSFVKRPSRKLKKGVAAFGWVYGVMCLLVVLCIPTGWFFYVDADGLYHDGPLYGLIKGMFFTANLVVLILVVLFRKDLPISGRLPVVSFCLFPVLAVAIAPYWYPTPEYAVGTVACVLLYHFFQEELVWQLTESKISITLSQMQPHFMYNVLNSIYHLCQRDPKLAQEAVDKFSDYLRNNMGSLEQTALIPFAQEYQHIQTYLSLEQLRFRNLEVVYDIRTTDFMLPPLTVQPLVENAVKHGITKKRGGGTVTISTWEMPRCFCVSVKDTGVGFDPELYREDGKLHIGIDNVRTRLGHMIGGTLNLTSALGAGTTAMIEIPKKEKNKRENSGSGR